MPEHDHSQDRDRLSVQGVYDALRGGRRHRRADEDAADALERAFTGTALRMLEERDFRRGVAGWAGARGIRQFIVAGAAMPAPRGLNLHEAAREASPDSVTVYAYGDRYAAAWGRALLAEGDPLVAAVEASVRSPRRVYDDPAVREMIDFAEPVCVVAPMVLHLMPAPRARLVLSGLAGPLAPGSVVAVSAWTGGDPERAREFARLFGHRVWRHSPADIERWMTAAGLGLEPEPRGGHPGVVDARLWPHLAWAAAELPDRALGRVVVAVGVKGLDQSQVVAGSRGARLVGACLGGLEDRLGDELGVCEGVQVDAEVGQLVGEEGEFDGARLGGELGVDVGQQSGRCPPQFFECGSRFGSPRYFRQRPPGACVGMHPRCPFPGN